MASVVDVLGVVIGGLYASGKLTDKVVIERELKKWLPEYSDHELSGYIACIWLTARCMHPQECTRSEVLSADIASPELPDVYTEDMLQIKGENTGNEPLSVPSENMAHDELSDCETTPESIREELTNSKATLTLKHCYVHLERIPQLRGTDAAGMSDYHSNAVLVDKSNHVVARAKRYEYSSKRRRDYTMSEVSSADTTDFSELPEAVSLGGIQIKTDDANDVTFAVSPSYAALFELDIDCSTNLDLKNGHVVIGEISRLTEHGTTVVSTNPDSNVKLTDVSQCRRLTRSNSKRTKRDLCALPPTRSDWSGETSRRSIFSCSGDLKGYKRVKPAALKCKICGKSFIRSSSLYHHERGHAADEKQFECDTCGKSFALSYYLIHHKRIHAGEKPFKCSICGKSFAQLGSVTAHKRVHSSERPYKCKICDSSFRYLQWLKRHKRVHSVEKPFKCDICGRSFAQSSNMLKHKRFHCGNKTFKCSICWKSFSQSNHLTIHKRVHRCDKPFKCGFCGKSFTFLGRLKTHARHHAQTSRI